MPNDYTYPSVYFAYIFFFLTCALAVYFFLRSRRDGYGGEHAEDAKFRMFDDDDSPRRQP
jgi:hypothetical protein